MINRVILIAVILLLAGCGTKEKKEEVSPKEETPPAPISNERPVMTFTMLGGAKIDAREIAEPLVLVLFQPDCNHCQQEARQIRNRLEAFRNYQLYFISSAPAEEINKFAREYKLDGIDNVHFGMTDVESVWSNYGVISAPSVYLYTKEGRLVQNFEGQVDVEVIIRYL
jgi:peroxiredoxin